MLSNASKYSINAVIHLAIESSEAHKIGIKKIAKAIDAPSPFLAKQLQILARVGIVSSSKGQNGGFYLTKENKEQKLISIVECIDGLSRFNNCVLGLKECNKDKPCPIHKTIEPFRKTLYQYLTQNSIASMAEKVKEGKTFIID